MIGQLTATPRQEAIQAGSFVLAVSSGGLIVAGRTLTVDEFVRGESALARGAFDTEFERERHEAHQSRGYLYGWWSSSIERGEWGTVHRAALICSITQEVYEGFMSEWDARPMPLKFE